MPQKRLFTITGNLLAETRAVFRMPRLGETVRAEREIGFQTGGKGINAARAADFFDIPVTAVYFPAGNVGARCTDSLFAENFCDLISVEIEGETREGLVCVDSLTGRETTFLGADIPVPMEKFELALENIGEVTNAGDVVALCGSFPAWNSEYASKLSDFCAKRRLALCVDTYGAPLTDLFRAKTDILKINRRELFDLFSESDDGSDEAFENLFSRAKNVCGAEYFGASDGSKFGLFSQNKASSQKFFPEKIEREVSATGCGDLMFACLVARILFAGKPAHRAFDDAAKIASLSAASPDIIGVSRAQVQAIFDAK